MSHCCQFTGYHSPASKSLWIIRWRNMNSARLDSVRTAKCSISPDTCLFDIRFSLSWSAPEKSITRSMNPFICSRATGVVLRQRHVVSYEVQSQEALSKCLKLNFTFDFTVKLHLKDSSFMLLKRDTKQNMGDWSGRFLQKQKGTFLSNTSSRKKQHVSPAWKI